MRISEYKKRGTDNLTSGLMNGKKNEWMNNKDYVDWVKGGKYDWMNEWKYINELSL